MRCRFAAKECGKFSCLLLQFFEYSLSSCSASIGRRVFFLEGAKIRLLLDVSESVLSPTRFQSFPILNYQSILGSIYFSTFSITNRQSIFSTIGIDIFDHQFCFSTIAVVFSIINRVLDHSDRHSQSPIVNLDHNDRHSRSPIDNLNHSNRFLDHQS